MIEHLINVKEKKRVDKGQRERERERERDVDRGRERERCRQREGKREGGEKNEPFFVYLDIFIVTSSDVVFTEKPHQSIHSTASRYVHTYTYLHYYIYGRCIGYIGGWPNVACILL